MDELVAIELLRRKTFCFNAKKAWHIAPCFKDYRTFKDIMASTGEERL